MFSEPGRRVIMPDRGEPFLGTTGRARARAVARRRRVFTVMLETLGLTFLIGLVPPLRAMWFVSAVLAALLVVYVWMLLRLRGGREIGRTAPASRLPATTPIARTAAAAMAAVTAPEYPVVQTADGRRVVVISDSALRRPTHVAG